MPASECRTRAHAAATAAAEARYAETQDDLAASLVFHRTYTITLVALLSAV